MLAEFKKNFARIEASTIEESDATDYLLSQTVGKLVTYLKIHDLSAAEAKSIGLEFADSHDKAHLRLYTYSSSSGGTRGIVRSSVFQWRNAAGQRFAYAGGEEGGFDIYPLMSAGRRQYLLLGGDNGDARCFVNKAWVVELKGNYLLLDNAVFGRHSLLSLCNVEMSFDLSKQMLRLDLSNDDRPDYNHDNLMPGNYRPRPGDKNLALYFRNGRFVKRI